MSESNRSQPVSLGCGTLLLIGLIVLMFSGGGKINDVKEEIGGLKSEIVKLQASVEKQTQELEQLRIEVGQVNRQLQQEKVQPQ